jgi:hypothetical protein
LPSVALGTTECEEKFDLLVGEGFSEKAAIAGP